LDVVKQLVREELENENWLRLAARLSGHSYEEFRVISLEFLDTDIFNLSPKDCVSFLSPLIESWHIDLTTFGMDIVLNQRLAPEYTKRLEFVERDSDEPSEQESGLKEFLRDPSLSGDATEEEIQFLKRLQFRGKRPTALYYYRELQNLRDPVHFRELWRDFALNSSVQLLCFSNSENSPATFVSAQSTPAVSTVQSKLPEPKESGHFAPPSKLTTAIRC
jgi:hypothetical protein